jgi:hypothetical protein
LPFSRFDFFSSPVSFISAAQILAAIEGLIDIEPFWQ